MLNKFTVLKNTLKFLVLFPIALLVLYGSVRLGLNYSGYCYEQKHYLSDQEKIEIAVRDVLGTYPPNINYYYVTREKNGISFKDVIPFKAPNTPIFYRDKKEFYEVNPDCCEVTDYSGSDFEGKGEKISMLSKLIGSISSKVRVRYQVRYYDSNGDVITVFTEHYIAISNCGRPWSGI